MHWQSAPVPLPRERSDTLVLGNARLTFRPESEMDPLRESMALRHVRVHGDSLVGWGGPTLGSRRRIAVHRDQVLGLEYGRVLAGYGVEDRAGCRRATIRARSDWRSSAGVYGAAEAACACTARGHARGNRPAGSRWWPRTVPVPASRDRRAAPPPAPGGPAWRPRGAGRRWRNTPPLAARGPYPAACPPHPARVPALRAPAAPRSPVPRATPLTATSTRSVSATVSAAGAAISTLASRASASARPPDTTISPPTIRLCTTILIVASPGLDFRDRPDASGKRGIWAPWLTRRAGACRTRVPGMPLRHSPRGSAPLRRRGRCVAPRDPVATLERSSGVARQDAQTAAGSADGCPGPW